MATSTRPSCSIKWYGFCFSVVACASSEAAAPPANAESTRRPVRRAPCRALGAGEPPWVLVRWRTSFPHSTQREVLVADSDSNKASGSDKRKQSLYFPESMLQE